MNSERFNLEWYLFMSDWDELPKDWLTFWVISYDFHCQILWYVSRVDQGWLDRTRQESRLDEGFLTKDVDAEYIRILSADVVHFLEMEPWNNKRLDKFIKWR